jgi:midasin (ATPase involved in ribosome maturation)
VRPHPHFMLFATQNPPGAYAGRKALSRAFRGRFLELHVEEPPDGELTGARGALPAAAGFATGEGGR